MFHLFIIQHFTKQIFFSIFLSDGSEKLSDNSPGAASVTSAEIANEFAALTFEEQERLRSEWSQVSAIRYSASDR